MRAVILLAILGTALATNVVSPKQGQRIVGGSPTTVEVYPYMVNFQYGFWGIWWYQFCGGTLINNFYFMTAAHCTEDARPTDVRAVLGTSFASSGGVTYEVAAIIDHPQYNPSTLDGDMSLVRFTSSVAFTNSIQAASIPSTNYAMDDGTALTAIGWGSLSSGGSYPEQLQHVEINLINQDLCAERYAELKTQPGFGGWPDITAGMLCAGILDEGGKDACQGDSGGPLAHLGNIVVGVTSWGYGCAHAVYPGVNARVSYYSEWVVANAV